MLEVMYILASSLMIVVGFILDNIILFLVSPAGYILFAYLVLFEYLGGKNIIKGKETASPYSIIVNYIKDYQLRNIKSFDPEWTAIGAIFRRKKANA